MRAVIVEGDGVGVDEGSDTLGEDSEEDLGWEGVRVISLSSHQSSSVT
jgi:hypothetical protein